jgi:hypothetical protein
MYNEGVVKYIYVLIYTDPITVKEAFTLATN